LLREVKKYVKSEEHRFLIITDEMEFSEALSRYIRNLVGSYKM